MLERRLLPALLVVGGCGERVCDGRREEEDLGGRVCVRAEVEGGGGILALSTLEGAIAREVARIVEELDTASGGDVDGGRTSASAPLFGKHGAVNLRRFDAQ